MTSTSLRGGRIPLTHSHPEISRSLLIPFYEGGKLSFKFNMSTFLAFLTTVFSTISIICFLAGYPDRIILPLIFLFLSPFSHLGGALIYGFTSLVHLEYYCTLSSVHLEWKGKDRKKALSSRANHHKGENAKSRRIGRAFWNFGIGLMIAIGAIHASGAHHLLAETVAAICLALFTA